MHDAARAVAESPLKTGFMIYLAGPIDAVKCGAKWREEAERHLHNHGFSFFKPWEAYSLADTRAAQDVMNINRLAIAASAGVLMFLPYGVTTIGTIREIEIATLLRLPVAVVSDQTLLHVSLADTSVFTSTSAAVAELKRVIHG